MRLFEDIKAVKRCDPAARYGLEIVLLYSGMHAVWGHRFAHILWRMHLKFLARFVSQLFRFLTGVEIHPGATLGRRFVIDHGMGVVIGETAIVGDDCLIYHGVTLGGRVSTDGNRRHPKLGNNIIVGANASILGAITVGDDARIGSDAVVIDNVPAGAVFVGRPARQAKGNDSIEYYL